MHSKPRLTASRSIRPVSAVAVASLGLVLAACGGGGGGGNADASDTKLVSTTPQAKGDVDQLTWNLTSGEPDVIDPANAATYAGGTVVDNLCDPLLRVKPDFSTEPNLASVEQVSPTQVVFTVRGGATFWDGKPVTAEDVAYSLNRSADPSKIVSFVFGNVSSIKATSDTQVTVDFKQPDELFTKEMGAIAGVVVEKAFAEKAGDALGTPEGGLMCSGPFKLDKWTSGDNITMSRNEDYWNDKYRARPAKVKFTFISDSTALTQALNAGEIDGAYELSPAAIPALKKSSTGTLRFGPSTQSLSISVANPGGQLASNDLRQALQVMIDREALAKVVYKGAATPNYTYMTPTTWENDGKEIYQPAYDGFKKARAYDIAKAKKLVSGSGYDGSELVLAVPAGDEAQSQVAQLIQQSGKEAGISISIKSLQALEFSQAQFDATKRKGIDLLINSSFNGVQDPVEPTGFDYLPDGFYNYTGYDNPEVTALIGQILGSFDVTERATLFVKAQAIFEQDSKTIPLLSTNTVSFLNNDLTGAVTSFAYWSMPSMALIGSAK